MKTLDSALNHHKSGNFKRAIAAYKKFLKRNPEHELVLFYLGLACFEDRKFIQARSYLLRKLKKLPGTPADFNLLGLTESEIDNSDAAIDAFSTAVDLAPEFFEAWNNLGNEFRKKGDLKRAIWCYKTSVSINKEDQIALENLANSYFDIGDTTSAQDAFEALCVKFPDNGRFHAFLGELLSVSDPKRAEKHFKFARLKAPSNDQITEGYVDFLAAQLRHREALEIINVLIEDSAGNFNARNKLFVKKGRLLKQVGLYEEAEAAFRGIIHIAPHEVGLWSDIASLKTFKKDDPDIAAIENSVALYELDDRQISSAYFSLAKAHDDLQDFDQSFFYLEQGNRLRRAQFYYNVEDDLVTMKKISEVFSDWPKFRAQIDGNSSEIPIIIVGMPRSGTSLVEQILASHPRVNGGGENLYFRTMIENVSFSSSKSEYPDFMEQTSAAELMNWFAKITNGYLGNLGAKLISEGHVTDKLPNNFLYLGVIALAFPRAKIIHCQRDPVDTCFSCFQQEFDSQIPFAWDLKELSQYYQGYRDLMRFWQITLPEQIINIQYEDLITDQEGQIRKLLAACSLSWSSKCLDFHQNKRAILTASFKQVRQPIYQSSNQKWLNYKSYLEPLRKSLVSAAS